jgi:hypothetical protein
MNTTTGKCEHPELHDLDSGPQWIRPGPEVTHEQWYQLVRAHFATCPYHAGNPPPAVTRAAQRAAQRAPEQRAEDQT